MLGHDDVADRDKSIFLPGTLQNPQEEIRVVVGRSVLSSPCAGFPAITRTRQTHEAAAGR